MLVLLATVVSFILMEILSWILHKYVMHGPLWNIHRTHHVKKKGFFELNDLFSLFFGAIAIFLLLWGLQTENPLLTGSGLGISLYGLIYFIVHDILIHRRLKAGGRIRNRYLKALHEAHRDHHKVHTRDGSTSFGLLFIAPKYFRKP